MTRLKPESFNTNISFDLDIIKKSVIVSKIAISDELFKPPK